MSTITRWWWVRHAPSMGDQGIIHGQDNVNANLSDTGAIRRLGKRLPKDGLWFSSNLRRTIETAKEISGGGGLHRLKYRNLPSRILANGMAKNGKSYQKKEMDNFWTNYSDQKAPEGESFRELVNRATAKIKCMTAENIGRDLIVVAHAGTIRAALTLALNLPLNSALYMSVSNLSLTKIEAFDENNPFPWRVEFANLPATLKNKKI